LPVDVRRRSPPYRRDVTSSNTRFPAPHARSPSLSLLTMPASPTKTHGPGLHRLSGLASQRAPRHLVPLIGFLTGCVYFWVVGCVVLALRRSIPSAGKICLFVGVAMPGSAVTLSAAGWLASDLVRALSPPLLDRRAVALPTVAAPPARLAAGALPGLARDPGARPSHATTPGRRCASGRSVDRSCCARRVRRGPRADRLPRRATRDRRLRARLRVRLDRAFRWLCPRGCSRAGSCRRYPLGMRMPRGSLTG